MIEPESGNPGDPSAPPGALYHYTDLAGLWAILKCGYLRATSIEFMNDNAERVVTINAMRKQFELRAAKDEPAAAGLRGLLNWFQPSLVNEPDRLAGVRQTTFAASFSTQPDQLSQWGRYGRGFGYALEIDPRALEAERLKRKMQWMKCKYVDPDSDDEEERGDKLFASAIDEIAGRIVAPAGPSLSDITWVHFRQFAPWIKHRGFKDEHEWRLVSHPPRDFSSGLEASKDVGFYAKKSVLVPYLEVPITHEALQIPITPENGVLKGIWIGPHPHPETAREGLWFYQRAKGLQWKVEISRIPYRDLP